jgi:acyl-CoA synthetase (NDP forming)
VARLLATQPIPVGKRVGILTNAGGPAILAVDAAEAAGLQVPTLSDATQARLRAILPPAASVNNPVDMIASATPEHYRACLEVLCDEPSLDALLVIFIPPLVTPSAEVAQVISEVVSKLEDGRELQTKPILAVFLDPEADFRSIKLNDKVNAAQRSIPVYNFPESAITALGAAARYGSWRAEAPGKLLSIELDRAALDDVLQNNGAGLARARCCLSTAARCTD